MAALSTSPMNNNNNLNLNTIDTNFEVDKLTYEIFSILENKFLFGYTDTEKAKNSLSIDVKQAKNAAGKVRILCIDGAGYTDGILAAKSLSHLESCLRRKSGNNNSHIADFFDAVAGSGVGGVLAALLFTRGKDGLPLFTADEALKFLINNRNKISRRSGILRRVFSPETKSEKLFRKTFGECTLKDTLKPILIPCYDLVTRAPFVFSRADALEIDGYDFKMRDVCAATSADPAAAIELKSIDGKTKILAVDGGVAMNNPTATAVTHVLNNKHEFPFCNGVSDLLVLSLGNGELDFNAVKSPSGFVRIAGEGASDMVDQAVSMAFGECRLNNYVRIQSNGAMAKVNKGKPAKTVSDLVAVSEEMLAQKNVESVLFKGRKVVENTNLDKLELFGGELIKEEERRKTSILPTVVLKNGSPSPRTSSPRTSSATTLSTSSSSS
ncbi:putative galactolipase [Medicago truncatula]|uniref:Patatin n=1 Tax=Medicago truncatula TaxID=3880 RepID=A0A072VFU2_MEDTR|nr:patatin-like protein 7 [Medicago truncatula]KEH37045.1 patatin-like phospholipase [Medicago truncatula]RHN72834.1 putative galactolipase [Medicago truncatula]